MDVSGTVCGDGGEQELSSRESVFKRGTKAKNLSAEPTYRRGYMSLAGNEWAGKGGCRKGEG